MLAEIHDFQPGNGTRYHILLNYDTDNVYLTWFRYYSNGLATKLPLNGHIHYDYLRGKLDIDSNYISDADIAALLLFIEKNTSNTVSYPPNFEGGLYSPSQATL